MPVCVELRVLMRSKKCKSRGCATVRCSEDTKNGERCKNMTTVYPHMCWLHTRQKLGLAVAKSTIQESGNGLFTLKDIKKGEKVADYDGKESATNDPNNNSDYVFQAGNNRFIDAESTQSSLGRYVNDCGNVKRRKKKCVNSRFSISTKKGRPVFVKATKNIKKGSEIFLSYGTSYWKKG